MGLIMAPATESIMGSLPLAKAGVGSAVNDTTRQVGGALGVAIVGSVLSSVYGSQDRPTPSAASSPPTRSKRRGTRWARALQVADKVGGAQGAQIVEVAKSGFVDAHARRRARRRRRSADRCDRGLPVPAGTRPRRRRRRSRPHEYEDELELAAVHGDKIETVEFAD